MSDRERSMRWVQPQPNANALFTMMSSLFGGAGVPIVPQMFVQPPQMTTPMCGCPSPPPPPPALARALTRFAGSPRRRRGVEEAGCGSVGMVCGSGCGCAQGSI